MEIPSISAWPRQERGRRACRGLRRRGLIPVVLYGRGGANVLLAVRERELAALLKEHSLVLSLEWDGQQSPVQLKEVQYDHVGEEILHADFGRISLTEAVRVAVAIQTRGEPVGVKDGGVLELVLHEVVVECLPTNIPETIRVDVAELKIGDAIRIGDLSLPEGVQVVRDPAALVMTVVPPPEVEEEAVPEEVAGEPEEIEKPPLEAGAEEGEGPEGQQAGS